MLKRLTTIFLIVNLSLIGCKKEEKGIPPSPPVITPVVKTNPVSLITSNTVEASGLVTSEGGITILAKGLVWSTSPLPLISLPTKTTENQGTGEFKSKLTGLSLNTTYYLRAYATTSNGTVYGAEISFKTLSVESVVIGTQIWMTKNLDVTSYRNGDPITEVKDQGQWAGLTSPAWSYYNNTAQIVPGYGKLYNWYAVNDIRNIAPEGWHVPTASEWETLYKYLGGLGVAGPKLSSSGNSGFNSFSIGVRSVNGTFLLNSSNTSWWSVTEFSNTDALMFGINFTSIGGAFTNNAGKKAGYSIRCIKD